MTCRGSQKSHKDEGRSNHREPLERGGRETHCEGHGPNYDLQGREKTGNWDENGATDAGEISESSDSDSPNPPYWPSFDDSEDAEAFEDDDYGEYGEEGETNQAPVFQRHEHASQHLSQVDGISLPPKNPRKVDEKV